MLLSIFLYLIFQKLLYLILEISYMKNLVLLLLLSWSLCSCNTSENKKNINKPLSATATKEIVKDPFLILYNDLMLPGSGKLFRGVDFDMSRSEIKKIELARVSCVETDSEKDNQLIITTDMGSETLDFADIKYTFDEKGMYYIEVETYAITKEKSSYVYNKIKDFYTSSLGEGTLAEDDYLEFSSSNKRYKYQVAIKEINLEATETDDATYGMFILISML